MPGPSWSGRGTSGSSEQTPTLDLALQMLVGSVFARRIAGQDDRGRLGRTGRRRHLGRHGPGLTAARAGPGDQGRMPRT